MNDFDLKHQQYRLGLQNLIERLKNNDTNIQSELLDLDWAVRNDLYRLDVIGKDAFEDEYDELIKFVPVIDAIKQKYNFNYSIEENSFDDYEDEDDLDDLNEEFLIEDNEQNHVHDENCNHDHEHNYGAQEYDLGEDSIVANFYPWLNGVEDENAEEEQEEDFDN